MKEQPCQGEPRLDEALTEYRQTDTLGGESCVSQELAANRVPAEDLAAGQTIARYCLRLVREADVPYDRRVCCDNPASAARFLHQIMEGMDREVFGAIFVNARHHVIGHTFAYVGTLHSAMAEPRGILVPALLANAAAVILFHNHPSGDPTPSPQDVAITRAMIEAGKLLDIEVLDHLVVGMGKYVSLKEKKLGF
jgi:DNA repair protein RadC